MLVLRVAEAKNSEIDILPFDLFLFMQFLFSFQNLQKSDSVIWSYALSGVWQEKYRNFIDRLH